MLPVLVVASDGRIMCYSESRKLMLKGSDLDLCWIRQFQDPEK